MDWECKCIGIRVVTTGLDAEDQLLEEDEIATRADSGVEKDDNNNESSG